MKAIGIRAGAVCSAVLIAACAPDAWKKDPAYNTFLNQIQNDCYYKRIGEVDVGGLLNNTGSNQGDYFIDQTSRLQAGQITPENWTSAVTAFLDGRSTDPGIECVLRHLPKR